MPHNAAAVGVSQLHAGEKLTAPRFDIQTGPQRLINFRLMLLFI